MKKLLLVVFIFASCFFQVKFSYAEESKVKIAIGSIEYRAKDSSENKEYEAYGKGAREDTRAFVDMLTTALVKTNKFDVIERDRMAEILKEQGLTLEGIAKGGYQGEDFNLKGVDYILTGAITEYGETTKAFDVIGFSKVTRTAAIAVDIRILDVEHGGIAIADTVRVTKQGGASMNMSGLATGKDNNSGALLGEVMRDTATNVTNLIVTSIYPVKVVAVTNAGAEVVLNYGAGFLKKGDVLEIFSQGEAIIDPDTGEKLGSEEKSIGKVVVFDTQAKFSKAKIEEGSNSIEKGMVARLLLGEEAKEPKQEKKKLF